MTPDHFKEHVATLDFTSWRPIGIVWHNTASPDLKRWHEFSRDHWMTGLESYYKSLGWNGGPHLFCDDGDDGIGLFNQLNRRGTHSPSFNAQYIGIEHVGDYNKEDDDAGIGLKVKTNGIIATAILCARLGIPADADHIKLHKEDPRTDHDCPGKDMADDKLKSIQAVLEYMGTGGDHSPDWGHVVDPPKEPPPSRIGTVTEDGLNVRSKSSTSGVIISVLHKGDKVHIVGEVMNGSSKWFKIESPAVSVAWVNARYVTEGAVPFPVDMLFRARGRMSTFGGPHDTGMRANEGLGIYQTAEDMRAHLGPDWVLSASQAGSSGLGRRLNPEKFYIACRWNYDVTPREVLKVVDVRVTNSKTGAHEIAKAVDWGPNEGTGRAADLSPGLAAALGLETNSECIVEVIAK